MKKKYDYMSLDDHHYEREPSIKVESLAEIQKQFESKVSSEGIYNLHTSVETMNKGFTDKIASLESIINKISLKDDQFVQIRNENY